MFAGFLNSYAFIIRFKLCHNENENNEIIMKIMKILAEWEIMLITIYFSKSYRYMQPKQQQLCLKHNTSFIHEL